MAKRKFDSHRLYKLSKWIIIVISVLSLFLGLYLYNQIQTNVTLHIWEDVCRGNADFRCMGYGFAQINQETNVMWWSLIIGIGLPIIFFGGIKLFKYLFPENKA